MKDSESNSLCPTEKQLPKDEASSLFPLQTNLKPGPFQIIEVEGSLEAPISAPRRRYDCHNYETCLELAAALNWDSFTCRGCSGNIDQAFFWRALHARKKDRIAEALCSGASKKFATECVCDNPLEIDPAKVSAVLHQAGLHETGLHEAGVTETSKDTSVLKMALVKIGSNKKISSGT